MKKISIVFYGIKNSDPFLVRSNWFILNDLFKNYEFSSIDYIDQYQENKPDREYDVFVYHCREKSVDICHFGQPLTFEEVKESVIKYKPKIVIQLGDELVDENNDDHNLLGNYCELFLRQHRHEKQVKTYTKNTIQIPVGYANDYLSETSDIKKIVDREFSWSWVGQMTTNAEIYKVDRDEMIREFWKIWNNFTVCDSFDKFRGPKVYNLFSNSIFVPCGRGNWSLECFRNFEATTAGAIPVVAASQKEIEETFTFDELPPWIYANSWEEAVKKCTKLLENKELLQSMQDENLAWWERIMNSIRGKIDLTLLKEQELDKDKTFAENVLIHGGEVKTLIPPLKNVKGHGFFNPSVFNDKSSLYVISRLCNYTLFHSETGQTLIENSPLHYIGDEGEIFKTTNYFSYIDSDNLKPIFSCPVNTYTFDLEPKWHFSGLEDARLVKWDDKFYLFGTRRDTEETGIGRMELSEIVVEHAYSKEVNRYRLPAPGNDDTFCEKNWMPILSKPYHFVKWTNPTEIVRYDITTRTCETVLLKEDNKNLSNNLRGGSQVIDWYGGYLGIVHEAYHTYPNGKFDNEYKQQFVFWDKQWNIVKCSPQFSVMGAKIEFISGLTTIENDVIITFGYQDNASYILRVSKKFVEDFLNG